MANAPPQPELEVGQEPAPQEESVLDSVYNWLVDGTVLEDNPETGEQTSVVDSISSGLESVGATMTALIRGDAPANAPAEGEAKQEPAEGQAQQEEGVLENFSKKAQETTEGVSKSISEWYYGPPPVEGQAEAPAEIGPDGQPIAKPQGFKHTVDESIDTVKSWFGGQAKPEGEGANAAAGGAAPPPGDGKPLLADWFLPAKKEGEEGEEVKPETVDVDSAVSSFFSNAAVSLQKMVDKGPPPPDRTKTPASSSSGPSSDAGASSSSSSGPAVRRQPPPAVPRDTPKPAGAAGGSAAPPPRPVSSKAAVFGSTVNRPGVVPPPRPSNAGKPM